MLKKCLKYDIGAIYKLWSIAAAVFLSMSVPVGFAIRFMLLYGTENALVMILGVVAELVASVAVSAFALMTMIAICVRYYKSFFSDEGYLTFTLPVKRSTLFYSKVLNAVIWQVATAIVIALAVAIVAIILPSADSTNNGSLIISILTDLPFESIGGWGALMIVEVAMLAMLALLAETLFIYFCITLGSVIAKKQKIIVSVGIWYLINQIVLPMATIALAVLGFLMITSCYGAFPELEEAEVNALLALVLLVVDLAVAAICAVLTFVNIDSIERKLNLT